MPFLPGARKLDQLRDVNVPTVAQGDILIRAAALWQRLAAGVSGQFLKTLDGAANPEWATIPADAAAAVASLRTLGTGVQQAAPGNHAHTLVKDTSDKGSKAQGADTRTPTAYCTDAPPDGVTTTLKELTVTTVANAYLWMTAYFSKTAGDETYNYAKLFLNGVEKVSSTNWDTTTGSIGYVLALEHGEVVASGSHILSARLRNTHFSRARPVIEVYLAGVSVKV